MPQKPHSDPDMGIYTAVYSGINVYEMDVNNVAVMRRQNDSWLNATQILKVAGVDKGRRTKILEKEIQTGEHEKIQGGYGKYQGTWIPFERGVEVCQQYGVAEVLMRLLTHNRGHDGPDVETPTKEQAMAAQRKRMYNAASQENRANGASGTFFKNISSTASTAINAITKARFDSPAPRNRGGPARAPSFHRQSSMQDAATSEFPSNSQQSFVSDYGHAESAFGSQASQQPVGDGEQPARKRQRVLTPAHSFGGLTPTYPQQMDTYAANYPPGSPTEPNESFIYSQAGVHVEHEPNYPPGPLRPLPYHMSPEVEAKRSMLMGLFMDPSGPDEAKVSVLPNMTPQELDTPIDTQSHTALHWAATLSRMPLLRALIDAGASPFRVNASGETALMRACIVTNSMDHNSFPELLDVLGGTIDVRDDKGRTVLHHIAVTSAVKGRNSASRYYLESLLEWVVRQGSAPSSQNTGFNAPARMGIGRFMSEIVNAQDSSGDTALNIAARIGNRSIVSQLLEVGADPNIANRSGLRPVDFGIGTDSGNQRNGEASDRNGASQGSSQGSSQKNRENSDEVVNSITHLVTESSSQFQTELKKKQDSIDSLHGSLRTTSSQVGEARRSLEGLHEKLKAQQLARQKVANHKRACQEEERVLIQLEQRYGQLDVASANAWEMDLEMVLERAEAAGGKPADEDMALLPGKPVLRARVAAMRERLAMTRRAVEALQARSKARELKYRRLVALCTHRPEAEVDTLLDTLTRAVESEKGELEIGRVRRFLGGVEGVA
ncbi:hypothetical protein C8A05DRAFT_14556 [Staphylotrichum tortipilum]|uniref:Transcription factor SWI6 n=1 Tax=Staphylotrichum tortipilum TaxID=2831512 RepID=A0AAN6MN83_9PEZI|nr:hypothetical protein C8A05DRAFT_14556 [Staphylotrichum longicolle]